MTLAEARTESRATLEMYTREEIMEACTPEEERLAAFGVLPEKRRQEIAATLQAILDRRARIRKRIRDATEPQLMRMRFDEE